MEIGGAKMIAKKDDHVLTICQNSGCKRLNISKKKKFTILEGIKLFSLMSTSTTAQLHKNQFWQKLQETGVIPERSAESMKKFWLQNKDLTVE